MNNQRKIKLKRLEERYQYYRDINRVSVTS